MIAVFSFIFFLGTVGKLQPQKTQRNIDDEMFMLGVDVFSFVELRRICTIQSRRHGDSRRNSN
jgi:hypothetical protein